MTTDIQITRNQVRIPNLPMGRIVDENGKATDDEMTFRQALLTLLEQIVGTEGLVMPQQSSDNIATIQNNIMYVPVANAATPNAIYTCAYGTMIYNTTANSVQIAIDNGSGEPIFKTVTLT